MVEEEVLLEDYASFANMSAAGDFNDSYDEHPSLTANSVEIYQVPISVMVLLSILYGSISLTAVVGNIFVIWIIMTTRRMYSTTNCYIANLACADVVIAVFSIPFQFQAALLQRWNLPEFMCAFCPFVAMLSVNVSIFTLTAIAVDRYDAILRPLKHRPTSCKVKAVLAVIWAAGAAGGVPYVLAVQVVYRPDTATGKSKPFCDQLTFTQSIWHIYNYLLVIFQYILPLTIIGYTYLKLCCVLWGSQVPGNAQQPRDATVLKNKKKVVKMLIIIVMLFAVCWLPLQSYHALQAIFPSVNRYKYINIIWFFCHWLAMSNSCCNPFIYGIYNERFQRELRLKFKRCCCSVNPNHNDSNSFKLSTRMVFRRPRPVTLNTGNNN